MVSWTKAMVLTTFLFAPAAWAQSPPPSCETQVSEHYQSLVKDQFLGGGSETAWLPQLNSIATQVRLLRTQYDIKQQQAQLAEQNVAQLLEQLRVVGQHRAALQVEVERLKAQPPPAN